MLPMKIACDDSFEIRLTEPYSEFTDFPSSNGAFDDSDFKQNFNEVLPAPTRFMGIPSAEDERCGHGVIISLLKPHKILAVSDGFLNMVGFSSSQVCGRSMNTFFGPETDTTDIIAAIKNTGHLKTTELSIVLYTSSGRRMDLSAAFSPLGGRSGDCLRGCLLRINFIQCEGGETCSPIFILDEFSCASTSKSPKSSKSEVLRRRREANLVIGLDNDAERQKQLQRQRCT
jgi:hypothetical protein